MSMYNFLFMIFTGYILYGLSGSLLNGVWPEVANNIGAQVSFLGIATALCYVASGMTSAFVYKIRRKYGTNITISIGISFLALAVILFAIASNAGFIGVAFVILGIGNAIVDVGANSYVVKAYDAKKVSLLHACWGIGSAVGPVIMSFAILFLKNYRFGFAIGAAFNIVVVIILRFMKRKWEANKQSMPKDLVELHSVSETEKSQNSKFSDIIKISLALPIMICFFFGNAFNGLMNTWIATIFVTQRNITTIEGANTATIFFLSITFTRIVLGFIADKFKTKNIIIASIIISLIGILMIFIKSVNVAFIYANALVIGIGLSPIIPFLNHYLKELFGKDNVGEILSFSSVFSLTGIGVSSFFATLVVRFFGMDLIQVYIIVIAIILLLIFSYIVYKANQKEKV